jgi:hypothetical protein
MFEVDLGRGHDHAMINHVVHNLPHARTRVLLARARAALRPGGTVSVLDVERPPAGRRGDQFGALAALLFYSLDRTSTYTADELCLLMREAGFADVQVKRPVRLGGNVLVLGRNAA